MLKLGVDVVHCRRAHDSWRWLALHDDVDHEWGGSSHGDVDVDKLH